MPGVPLSMKSCASKCERVESGLPTACTTARLPSCQSGQQRLERGMQAEVAVEVEGGVAGCRRAGRGCAMVGRRRR